MLFVLTLLFIYHRKSFSNTWNRKVIELQLYFCYLIFHKISIFFSKYLSSKVVNLSVFFYGCFERISKHPHQLFLFYNASQKILLIQTVSNMPALLYQFYFQYEILGRFHDNTMFQTLLFFLLLSDCKNPIIPFFK